jgi:uncharacterized protein (DUF433 family)
MRFGINLRGDLAKLDDTEIAKRYERLVSEKEKRLQKLPKFAKQTLFRWIFGLFLGRGPLHAPIFYKTQMFVGRILGALSQAWIDDDAANDYYSECEFKDVQDEIECRIRQRKSAVETL